MNKRQYFLDALHSPAAMRRDWVFSVFSVVRESGQPKDDYFYKIIRRDDGVFFVDPGNDDSDDRLTQIEDAVVGEPLLAFRERLAIKPGEIGNYQDQQNLVTTYGNALINHLCLVVPFGQEIPYQTGYIDMGKVEKMILSRWVDDPEDDDGSPSPPGQIYVREYTRFADIVLSMVAYNALSVQSVTPKSMMGHPAARQLREELMEKYKDQLTDPAIIARIGDALEKLDREWLKDDPTMDFYISGKHFTTVRKKLYYMFGAEAAFGDGTSVRFLPKSLEEGIDVNELPAMINSLREGSYNRGSLTQLGGEATKTIYRMLGTVSIVEDDCGTTLGIPMVLTDDIRRDVIDFWVIQRGRSVLVKSENVDSFKDQEVQLRSPMTCKTAGRNKCSRCMGQSISEQPDAIAAAAAQVGGRFMTLMLKAMHGKALKTQKWDYQLRLS